MKYLEFIQNVKSILPGEEKKFSIEIIPTHEDIEWKYTVRGLESEGFVIAAITKNFPDGVYIAEGLTENKTLKGWKLENEIATEIIVKNIQWPFKSKKPQPPNTQKGLKVVTHHTMAVIFGTKTHGWKTPQIIPYGIFGLSIADTSGIQYGQAAFEGACAMKNKNQEVFGFRLDKNSERFTKSMLALNLPDIAPDIIEDITTKTIQTNKEYIPNHGDGQLYIRPSVCGLSGGLGIIVPDNFIITVEIAAMGAYFAPTISIEGRRDIQRPATGTNKIAPNYGSSFLIKEGVKKRGYTDYLSFDKNGYTEEVATCAVGFIDTNGVFIFPPVQGEIDNNERHILPSITRYSTIEVLKKSGKQVEIRDVHSTEIFSMMGMFTMGNAVGILHVDKICMKEDASDEGEIITFLPESKKIIESIKEKIFSARIGELQGFENWVKKI